MTIKSLIRILFPLLVLASLAACNLGAAPTATEVSATLPAGSPEVSTPTQEATATQAAVQGACANSLYPIVKDATWSYRGSGGPSGEYSFTDTISEVRADGFTLTSVFDDNLTRTQQWACNPEGLVALQMPGAAGVLTADGMNATLETSNIQGVTLPASVSPGDQWSFSMEIHGTMESSGFTVDVAGPASFSFNAVGMESVTVPAGTFDAMKVNGQATLDFSGSASGITIPVKLTMSTVSWYAPGVGMVKTVTTGDMLGTPFTDTLELQTYTIP